MMERRGLSHKQYGAAAIQPPDVGKLGLTGDACRERCGNTRDLGETEMRGNTWECGVGGLVRKNCKTAKLQYSLTAFTPLQEFLQNYINFSLNDRSKAKFGEKDALLQEFNKIRAEIA